MRFMMLLKATADSEAGVMPRTELLEAMGRYNQELADAGVLLSGEGLHPTSRGVRVQLEGAKRTVTEGPFAHTGQLIAGFWLLRTASLEDAIEWAKRCPSPFGADTAELELRQVVEADDFGDEFTADLRDAEERLRVQLQAEQEQDLA